MANKIFLMINNISAYNIWSMTGSVALTSTADTNESEEEVLSIINVSSKSSLAKMSAILSVMENKHYNLLHNIVLLLRLHHFVYPLYFTMATAVGWGHWQAKHFFKLLL